eukprot:9489585-Pyramimonas_sp.AAC.1
MLVILNKREKDTLATLEKVERKAAQGHVVDEVGLDDLAAHTGKEGKWAKGAKRGVMSKMFFVACRISCEIKRPLQHMLHFIMQRREQGEPQNMAEMVWGKAAEIRAEFVAMTQRSHWTDTLALLAPGNRDKAWPFIAQSVTRALTDYDRRIMGRVNAFPCRLMFLVKTPAD